MATHNDFTFKNFGNNDVKATSKKDADSAMQSCDSDPKQNDKFPRKSKPKQHLRHKIDKLLKSDYKPNALASAALQMSKRFFANHTPANSLETAVFERLSKLPSDEREYMAGIFQTINDLPSEIRGKLFHAELLTETDEVVEPEKIHQILLDEITTNINNSIQSDGYCNSSEIAGRVRIRLNSGGDDVYPNQVRIFRINNLRTNDFLPQLSEQDYVPAELQSSGTCLGHRVGNACLTVAQVSLGEIVYLEGVNFFNTQAYVRLSPLDNVRAPREIDTWVCGDMKTPVNETLNGQTVLITDSRVQDHLRFAIPLDLHDGIYRIEVLVPNNSGIQGAGIGSILSSNSQYLQVLASDNARFKINCEELWCQKETSPGWIGSDEISFWIVGSEFAVDKVSKVNRKFYKEFEDVDSGERRLVDKVAYQNESNTLLHGLMITGYEQDSEQPNRLMRNYDTALDDIINIIGGVFFTIMGTLTAIYGPTGALIIFGASYSVGAALIIGLGIIIIVAGLALIYKGIDILAARWWGPADLVIDDLILLPTQNLAELTDMRFPAPPIYPELPAYITQKGIEVRRISSIKDASGYTEERQYISDTEGSKYVIRLKYSREN